MRRLAVLILFAAVPALAQPSFGVRAGLNVTTLGDFQAAVSVADEVPRLGPAVSVFARIPAYDLVSIQPEISYVTRGATLDYGQILLEEGGSTAEVMEYFDADYIDIGALARFDIPVSGTLDAGIVAGPAVAIKIQESIRTKIDGVESELDREEDFFLPADFGLVVGADVGAGPVLVDLRLTLGLTNVFDGTDLNPTGGVRAFEVKHVAASFTLGYRFGG